MRVTLTLTCLPFIFACASGTPARAPRGPFAADEAKTLTTPFIASCLTGGAWATTFEQAHGKKALIAVAPVDDKTGEARDTQAIGAALEQAVLAHGGLQLAASGQAQRDMLAFQATAMALQEHNDPAAETAGPDFAIAPSLTSVGGPGGASYQLGVVISTPDGELVCAAQASLAGTP